MFAIPCEKGPAGLSYVLNVAVRAGQSIYAALVKFRRRSGWWTGFQCGGLKVFRWYCSSYAMFMFVFLNILLTNFVCGPT